MIKLSYIILYVPDVAAALSFYETVFGLDRKFITPEGDYGELSTGETTLAFAHTELGKVQVGDYEPISPESRPVGMELAFTTEDVESLYEKVIANHGTSVAPPTVKPWGQTVAYVRDPFGFLIEVCTRIS